MLRKTRVGDLGVGERAQRASGAVSRVRRDVRRAHVVLVPRHDDRDVIGAGLRYFPEHRCVREIGIFVEEARADTALQREGKDEREQLLAFGLGFAFRFGLGFSFGFRLAFFAPPDRSPPVRRLADAVIAAYRHSLARQAATPAPVNDATPAAPARRRGDRRRRPPRMSRARL